MKRSSITVMRRLLTLVKLLTGTMILAVAMGVLGHLCAIFIPVLGGMAITGSSVKMVCIILPVIAVLRGIFHLLEQNRNHYLAFKLLALIRDQVFGALRKLAPAKLEGQDKGNIIAILTADIELLEVFYAHTISPVFIAVFVSVIMTGFIGSFHPALGALTLAAYMVVGIVVPVVSSKMSRIYGEGFREEFGKLDAFVLDSLRGVKESIQYGTGEKRLKEIYEYSDSLSAKEKKLKGTGGTSVAVTSGIILVFDVLMVLTAAILLEKGVIDGTSAVVSVIALMSSFGPVIALANLGTGLQNTIAAGNRVLDILDEEPVIREVTDKKEVEFSGADCEDVQFSYDGERILKDFSMDIPKKGIVGIIGKSGSGKSTFLKLLMRFWDVNEGMVSISGGEKQRLGVARAFLHDAPLILLDEPTSNLDSLNETVILKALKEFCKEKTVLLVSHRKSTMCITDRVVSVENGRMS